MEALVSVVIPTHNRSDLLGQAIRSVLAQDYPNVEIIVVDDHSIDDTPKTIQGFQDAYPSIRYFRLEGKTGANAARNAGIAFSRGLFVCGLDDDDEFHPERIRRLVANYRDEYAFVFSGYTDVREGKTITRIPRKNIFILDDILGLNLIGNQVLTTREKLLAVGGYDESLHSAQDYDLWIRLLERFEKAFCVRLPLYSVYFHSGETITKSPNKIKGYFAVYKKHKHLMSRTHRKEQLAILYCSRQKPLSPTVFSILVTFKTFFPLASLLIKTTIPWLHIPLRRIKKFIFYFIHDRSIWR